MARASAARIELVKHGMIATRVKRIIAYAGTEPLIPDDYFNPSNRRISIIILSEDIADIYKEKTSSENNEKSIQH
jgi:chemotaxis protein MotB